MEHRGACGCEVNTGDGAGILVQMPDGFFRAVLAAQNIDLPETGRYAAGIAFLPDDDADNAPCPGRDRPIVTEEGLQLVGWRDVPVDPSPLGPSARAVMPRFANCSSPASTRICGT